MDEQEGITRDRIYEKVDWSGKQFTLVDTGGYIPEEADVIDAAVREQVGFAITEASLILFSASGWRRSCLSLRWEGERLATFLTKWCSGLARSLNSRMKRRR